MKLNRKNYFSKEAEVLYLGSTSFKAWDIFHTSTEAFGNLIEGGCEARELAITKGEYEKPSKDAFLLGNYVHSWSSGDLKDFLLEHPEMFKKDGSLYAKFSVGDAMINCLKNDSLVQKFREGAEKEQIFTGEIAGVPFKIQVDILNIEKGYFADIKTTDKLRKTYWKDGKKCTFIDNYDYKLQFAIYAEILEQNLKLGHYLEPYVIAVDKQEIPNHEVIDMGTDFIEEKLEYIKAKLPHIIAVRNGIEEAIPCEECAYCRSKKEAKIITLAEYEESLGL